MAQREKHLSNDRSFWPHKPHKGGRTKLTPQNFPLTSTYTYSFTYIIQHTVNFYLSTRVHHAYESQRKVKIAFVDWKLLNNFFFSILVQNLNATQLNLLTISFFLAQTEYQEAKWLQTQHTSEDIFGFHLHLELCTTASSLGGAEATPRALCSLVKYFAFFF